MNESNERDSNELIFTLKHPVEIRAGKDDTVIETVRELRLTRPKGKHLRATDRVQGETAKALALIGACARQPASVTDELDAEDITALTEIVEGFFGGRPATGATSSGI